MARTMTYRIVSRNNLGERTIDCMRFVPSGKVLQELAALPVGAEIVPTEVISKRSAPCAMTLTGFKLAA